MLAFDYACISCTTNTVNTGSCDFWSTDPSVSWPSLQNLQSSYWKVTANCLCVKT